MTQQNTRMRIDPELLGLIRKYDRPGPRYTSYPPATCFTEAVDKGALKADMGQGSGALSLYFHIPFCETLCWFCGCHTITTLNHDRADAYLDLLIQEMDLTGHYVDFQRPVAQLHFGGGTPNFLTPEQIRRLGREIRQRFHFLEDAEISVELDPRHLSKAHAEAFREFGVNRASFGVQDANPEVQKAIHRVQPHEVNVAAMRHLRGVGVTSINLDLIYGLPLQTPANFARTLDLTLSLQPDRFAVFNYAHVPWMKPAQKILERHPMPSAEQKLALLKQIIERLSTAGFHYIGMDHFARPEDELVRAQMSGTLQRNFQGYSTRADTDIVAFGVSAISQTQGAYRQNLKDLLSYRKAIEAGELPLLRGYLNTQDDRSRRSVIMQLMCNLGLSFEAFKQQHGIDVPALYPAALEALGPMEEDGLLSLSPQGITIHERGRLFLRNLAMCFDATLKSEQNRYSRTV
jgi:oxygen-independent coproporphyrinogen-3 oxidase